MTIRETALRRIAIRHTVEITVSARGNPAHRVENGPANGEGQDGRRSRGRSYRTLVSGPRRRNLMPPCGSPLMKTTNSVSFTGLRAQLLVGDDKGRSWRRYSCDAIPCLLWNGDPVERCLRAARVRRH